MAGDWIKMRGNLWDDPRIAKLVDMTDKTDRPVSEATVVGALYWLWATADQHTEDGIMPGLSLRQIDRKTGVQGFGAALCAIGWLADHPDGVRIVNFEEHNGASAKRRSEDAKRKADVRKESDKDRTDSGREADKSGKVAELEKEKEKELEKKNTGRGGTARATRLPAAPTLPAEWLDFLQAERPDLNPDLTYAKFCDYWAAKPGKSGTKLDWLATWRNWVREEKSQAQAPPQRDSFREQDRKADMHRWEQLTGRIHPDRAAAEHPEPNPSRRQAMVIDVKTQEATA